MFHRKVPASLQNMEKSHHIRPHIGIRIINAVTHSCLRSQIDHHLRRVFLKQTEYIAFIAQVSFDKRVILICPQDLQSVFFQFHIIVIIQVVKTDDSGAFLQETSGQMKADKTCATCH